MLGEDGLLLTDKTKSKTKTKNGFSWWFEITAILIGLIAIFAIVATLYPHQGKPLPDWPFSISINTLLSIYSFVLKAAIPVVVGSCLYQLQWSSWFSVERPLIDVVRYDSAAKGPLGAIQWLWANQLSQPLTALGALITIVAVTIDPFVQQLILYQNCQTTLGVNASLPRINHFGNIILDPNVAGTQFWPDIITAMGEGVTGSPDVVEAVCSTGNCTFPQHYATLGYCSACKDLSDLVEVDIFLTDNNTVFVNATSILPTIVPLYSFYGADNTTYFAGGLVGATHGTAIVDSYGLEVLFLQGATYYSWRGIDPQTLENINGCDSAEANATLWKCRQGSAASCKFKPCVREYNASVSAGKLTETLVDSTPLDQEWGYSNPNYSDDILSIVDTQCTSAQDNASLAQLGYELNNRWIAYNYTELEVNSTQFPYSLYAHECVYYMDYGILQGVWGNVIPYLFSRNITSSGDYSYNDQYLQGLGALQTLYNYSDTDFHLIEGAFQNMSESLTNHMRLNGFGIPATGQVLHYATCLEVRWPWIALPASVMMATCVLLALTIIKVYRDTLPIWKTTILPIIFNGPAINLEKSLTEASMEKEAAKINVILERDAEGLKLVQI